MTNPQPNGTVVVRVSGNQNFDAPARDALDALRQELVAAGYQVRFPLIKTADITRATLEHVGLYIGSGASGAMLTAAVKDIYEAAKRWGKNLFKGKGDDKQDTPTSYVTIYGPDGTPLKRIAIKSSEDIQDVPLDDETE